MPSHLKFRFKCLSTAVLATSTLLLGACSSSRNYSDQQFSTQSLGPRPQSGMTDRPYAGNYLPPHANPGYSGPQNSATAQPMPSAGMVREPARPYGNGYGVGSAYEPPRAGEYRWNGNPNRVQEGATAPNTSPPPAPTVAASGQRTVVVRSGDTLFSLSRHYGVTVAALAEHNRLTTTAIHSGQTLVLPPVAR